MKLSNIKNHFKTITKHKLLVMDLCFKVGLIRQGLLHDMSKYSPEEFIIGVCYYQGYRSPNAGEKIAKGYSTAWLHHKGRNKHHFEYWIDYGMELEDGIVGAKMPLRYVLEMMCDRIAASKVYRGDEYTDNDPWIYYCRKKDVIDLAQDTRALLEKLLKMLGEQGEKKTLAYMRFLYKHPYIYEDRDYIKLCSK